LDNLYSFTFLETRQYPYIQTPLGLGHLTCLEPYYPNFNSHECWVIKLNHSRVSSLSYLCSNEMWYGARDDLLNLLQTCRQVYSEAIDLLYSGNTFDMATPGSIALLADPVLPHPQIRYGRYICRGLFYLFKQSMSGTDVG